MPFIDSKVTMKLTPEKEETIKSKLGEMITILGKPESFLMIGFKDEYDLYFAGNKLDAGAFVSVQLFGQANSSACDKMTGEICELYSTELGIPKNNIYITYQGISDWGWNGSNF